MDYNQWQPYIDKYWHVSVEQTPFVVLFNSQTQQFIPLQSSGEPRAPIVSEELVASLTSAAGDCCLVQDRMPKLCC
jgi:hypothetical protein